MKAIDKGTTCVVDFAKARKARQFEVDLAEALRPKRQTKATKQAVKLQAVRLAARQSL